MTPTISTETVASYVPALILQRLTANEMPLVAPDATNFPAAVLLADISGFTPLTEQLARQGREGVEELSHLLNDYFEQLIALITLHGGDIVNFAGDAVMAIWQTHDESLITATRRASQCAMAVQARLHSYSTSSKVRLSLHIGIGAGTVSVAHLGGVAGQQELVVAGSAVDQAIMAEHQAHAGQVVLAAEAWALIQPFAYQLPFRPQSLPQRYTPGICLAGLQTMLPMRPLEPMTIPPQAESALWAHIPNVILARLAAGQNEWLAELRTVTVLFVNLMEVEYNTVLEVEEAHRLISAIQQTVYRYEGTINTVHRTDRGTTLSIVFGLPPRAHEDDAVRGVQAANAIAKEMGFQAVRGSVGVATGLAFCGLVGSPQRRHYTILGNVVNLAARLMQVQESGILCDEATFQAANTRMCFEALPPVRVKGKVQPVTVFRPGGATNQAPRQQSALVGRRAEQAMLMARLDALRNGNSGVLLLEGEAGMGKTRLVEELSREAQALGVQIFLGRGDAIEKSTPYFAWRRIFSKLLDMEVLNDTEARRQHLLQLLELDPELVRLAPLLNRVLRLDLPENDSTSTMNSQVRADNTRDLLLRLLQTVVSHTPSILVLEDVHWFDSASWALTSLVTQRLQPLLTVITTRPFENPVPAEYHQLLRLPGARRLMLEALPPADSMALICQRLGAERMSPEVATLLRDRAEGHPFFSEELAYTLRDAGVLMVGNGEVQFTLKHTNLPAIYLPETVQGAITSRIDRLTPSQQLTLKVASVVGRAFEVSTLQAIYPMPIEEARLRADLENLQHLGFLVQNFSASEPAYLFKHVITQEVVYNLMLFARRRQLHQAVAEYVEMRWANDLSTFAPLLSYHWRKAEVVDKAINYLGLAGEQALRSGAYLEAVHFFSETLALADEPTVTHTIKLTPLKRARWERHLGEAQLGLGDLVGSRRQLEQAVARLGWPVADTRLTVAKTSAQGVGLILRDHLTGRAEPTLDNVISEEMAEAAYAYTLLPEIYHFSNEPLPAFHAVMQAHTLAQKGGSLLARTRSYTNLALFAASVPLQRVATRAYQRAQELAEQLNDPSTHAYVSLTGSMYATGLARWEEAQATVERSIALYDRIGDDHGWEVSLHWLGFITYFRGQFALGTSVYEELCEPTDTPQRAGLRGRSLIGQAMHRLRQGKTVEALALLDQAWPALTVSQDRLTQLLGSGVRAMALLQQGEFKVAQHWADNGTALLNRTSLGMAPAALEGYAGIAEVYLTLCEANGGYRNPENDGLLKQAQASTQRLQHFARAFPIGLPRSWRYRGRIAALKGLFGEATHALDRSVAEAHRLGLPYEEALAHCDLSRFTSGERQRTHRQRAQQLFHCLGATCGCASAAL